MNICVDSGISFLAAASNDEPLGLGKIFSDPAAFAKLAANPRTSKHLADPTFIQQVCFSLHSTSQLSQAFVPQLQLIQRNPALAQK
jgi:hypothetical protein